MKKYIKTFLLVALGSILPVLATPPLPPYSGGTYVEPYRSVFFQLIDVVSRPAMIFLSFSQIIVFSYLSYILYSIYISKKISMEGFKKIAVTIFAALYCSSVLVISFYFISTWVMFN